MYEGFSKQKKLVQISGLPVGAAGVYDKNHETEKGRTTGAGQIIGERGTVRLASRPICPRMHGTIRPKLGFTQPE